MKKKKKLFDRVTAVALAAAMVLTCCPTSAWAEEDVGIAAETMLLNVEEKELEEETEGTTLEECVETQTTVDESAAVESTEVVMTEAEAEPNALIEVSTGESYIVNGVTYALENGTLTISGGTTVTREGVTKFSLSSITSVVIEDGITTIGSQAFYYCSALEEITLPDGVTNIGDEAFRECTALTGIVLPEKVSTIGKFAFYQCTSLAEINFDEALTTVGGYAFRGCTGLTTLELPDSLATVKEYAFSGCTGLVSVTYPESLTSGYRMFNGCSGIESITVPEGVTELPDSVFYNMTGLKSVNLPQTLEKIGAGTFESCSALEEITVPEGVTNIGNYAFENCTALASVSLPDSVTTLGYCVFYNDSALSRINYPRSLNSCGNGSTGNNFHGCTSLKEITVPEGVTVIPDYVFGGADGLETVNLPMTLEKIGAYAFRECTALTEIHIPPYVTSLGAYAFYGDTALKDMYFYCDVPTRGTNAIPQNTDMVLHVLENRYGWAVPQFENWTTEYFENERYLFKTDEGAVVITVNDTDGKPLRNANIYINLGTEDMEVLQTDANGQVTITKVEGTYPIGVYLNEYLPVSQEIEIIAQKKYGITVELEKKPLYTISSDSHKMTLDEIKDAGIDVTDTENQNVWEFQLTLVYSNTEVSGGTVYVKENGEVVKQEPVKTMGQSGSTSQITYPYVWMVTDDSTHVPGPSDPTESGWEYNGQWYTPICGDIVLEIPGKASWLKDFFDIDVTIVNEASASIVFQDCQAVMNIPDGLTLMDTMVSNSADSSPATTISGGQSMTTRFILRGDAPGKYQLNGSFSALLAGFGIEIGGEFATDSEIEVRDGSELWLDFYLEDQLNGDTGALRVGFRNEGKEPVYYPNVALENAHLNEVYTVDSVTKAKINAEGMTTLNQGEEIWFDYILQKEDFEEWQNDSYAMLKKYFLDSISGMALQYTFTVVPMGSIITEDQVEFVSYNAKTNTFGEVIESITYETDDLRKIEIPSDTAVRTLRKNFDGDYIGAAMEISVEEDLKGSYSMTTNSDGYAVFPGRKVEAEDKVSELWISVTTEKKATGRFVRFTEPLDLSITWENQFKTHFRNADVSDSGILTEYYMSEIDNPKIIAVETNATEWKLYSDEACEQPASMEGWKLELDKDLNFYFRLTKELYDPVTIHICIKYDRMVMTFIDNGVETDISLNLDLEKLVKGDTSYDHNLAIACMVLSAQAENGADRVQEGLKCLDFGSETAIKSTIYNTFGYGDSDGMGRVIKIQTFQMDGTTHRLITVVCRGTTNGEDVTIDLGFEGGFEGQASQAKTTIEALLREIDPALSLSDPNNTYLITGHSLGGVVANILAAKLTRAGCTTAGYTFAAPPPVALTEPTLYEYKYSIYNFANSGAGISGDLVPQVSQDAILSELFIGGIGMGIGEALAKGALSRRYGTDFIFDSEATDCNGSAIRNMFKDLHGSGWNYSFDPLQRHSTSTYMAYLLTMEPSSYTFNREKRLIDIRCPVDVQVLNEKGEVVAEIVDNKIVFNNTDDVALLVADDEKIVQYDTAASYYLKLIGNDTGSMEIDVTDIATNEKEQKLSSSKGYVDIQLTDGKAFICDTEEVDAAKDVQLYLIDEDEKGTHIVETDGSETKLEEPIDFSKEPDEPDGPDGPDEPGEPDLPSVSDIFKDVSDSSWFKDAVQFVYDRGIIKGMTPDTFGPSVKLSRAQFAVMLYRMEKEPETEYTERFPDVAKGTWYTNAAMWASENKIITGYENGKFGPADQITREQMALMMYRYAKYKGYDVSVSAAFDTFKDAERVSGFAKEAMGWVVGMKIITGKQEGTALEPQGKASRAECATIIMRFMTAYVE